QAILLMRGIPERNAAAHRGEWRKDAKNSFEIRGKTLGIIGYGNIGSQLSILAEALGMQVIFFDVLTKLPLGNADQVATMDELLERADVVTLHVPETPDTKNMFGEKEFAAMKEGAALINASRGTVIDIPALEAALESGKCRGAAIDVFPVEPKSNNDEFISPLRKFDNVILTPHIGGSTLEAQANIGLEVADKFVRYSDNGSTLGAVNFPEVGLPQQQGAHRLLHIHNNIPGVLSEINNIFSEAEINILGQYLQTDDKIGYVVIEVSAASSEEAIQKLQAVKGTIRTRVLF
ncbi:MAG TPA: phosphoglycerate dehydrogenase, partial [Gammaproteobacteria bacterium]|nr:phosphoglycerate dehydrogenase [Gammaproteobacteria bacterium]